MNNDILDKVEEKRSYYDRSLAALKGGLVCVVSLPVIGVAAYYFANNAIIDYVLSLLFLFILLGGFLAFGLYGVINGIISIVKKEDYGIKRIVVLIMCFLLFLIPMSFKVFVILNNIYY